MDPNDLENTDYNNENTLFEALWNESDSADNIDEIEYKFYFFILIQMAASYTVENCGILNISSIFQTPCNETRGIVDIDLRTIKYYWSVRENGGLMASLLDPRKKNLSFAMQEAIKTVHELLHKECEIIKLQRSLEKNLNKMCKRRNLMSGSELDLLEIKLFCFMKATQL
ncbi:hypothetical protein RCL_jg13723.t1 [Rhizophagus clarus]|uniref:Uncharacterized protein n=1 Tax=Rhizophagus clarus TaxID=94130 RepID=A0A8H3R7C5_9GLOM|nr:hypothetical protein RCL_jg13723.t1 [Rhizophagus clarus]